MLEDTRNNTGDLILSNLERPGGWAGLGWAGLHHQLGECQQGSAVEREGGREGGGGII